MKALVLLPVFFLFFYLPSNVCGNEIYIWYDENGRAHYTHNPPPANALSKTGESWWQEDETSENDVVAEEGLDKAYDNLMQSVVEAEENNIPEQEDEHFDQRETTRKPKKKGFFSFFISLFKRDKEDDNDDNCDKYAWFVENHGICPLDEPKKDVIGSTFRAKVVDSRKGVWSSCKGTRNGDVYVFKNKGEGLWETDGGVPECPFYESFYWR